jgi:cell wall-associated NlpC family hydrolase
MKSVLKLSEITPKDAKKFEKELKEISNTKEILKKNLGIKKEENTQKKLDTAVKSMSKAITQSNKIAVTPNNTVSPAEQNNAGGASSVVDYARQFLGKFTYSMAYRNQTIGGVSYLDCSAYIQKVIKGSGIDKSFPGTVSTQVPYLEKKARAGDGVIQLSSVSQLQAGDLVYWYGGGAHHVAMMASQNTIIHESSSKKNVVEVSASYLKRRPPTHLFRYTTKANINAMMNNPVYGSPVSISPQSGATFLPGFGLIKDGKIDMDSVISQITQMQAQIAGLDHGLNEVAKDGQDSGSPQLVGSLDISSCAKTQE